MNTTHTCVQTISSAKRRTFTFFQIFKDQNNRKLEAAPAPPMADRTGESLQGLKSTPRARRASIARRSGVDISNGGGERDRTDDPLLAKQVLSQLSYTPDNDCGNDDNR